jgi:hypothetical protein
MEHVGTNIQVLDGFSRDDLSYWIKAGVLWSFPILQMFSFSFLNQFNPTASNNI